MSPLVVFLMLQQENYFRIISFIIVVCVSLTDALDGYYARKYNLISKLGEYLDPFADKVFILSLLFTLHYLLEFYIPLWMIMIILLRDISVTFLRSIFKKNKFEFHTSRLAKNKTLMQIISLHLIILLMIVNEYNFYTVNYLIFYYIMLSCSLVSLLSGFDYYRQYYILKNHE